MTGIDISGFQPDNVPGPWEFIVVKTTEGTSVVNPRADAQWLYASRTTRGLYTYARPGKGSAPVQAQAFIRDALARGFRPGVDIWQLDAEAGGNESVSPQTWQAYVDAFMLVTLAQLGPRGFLYAGWPFVQTYGLQGHVQRYKWWLPAYGRNDGNVNPYPPGTPEQLVVIHQFSSHGGLDQNRVVDSARYGASAPPAPAPKPKPVPPAKVKPMHKPYAAIWQADCDCPTGGAWILGTDGGVITVGSAPFLGSPIGIGVKLDEGVSWTEIRLVDPKRPADPKVRQDGKPATYVCITSDDHRYAF